MFITMPTRHWPFGRSLPVLAGVLAILIPAFGSSQAAGSATEILSQRVEPLIQESLGSGPYSFTLTPNNFDIPGDSVLSLKPPTKVQLGRNYFQMKISQGDREIQRVLTVDVTRSDSVWISVHALAPGEILTEEDIRREWLQHTNPEEEINFKTPIGMRTRYGIGSARILTRKLIEDPPTVQRGQKVLIRYRSSMLEIATMAEVREDGRAGDVIRVRVTDARKECRATVLDDGTLEVLVP